MNILTYPVLFVAFLTLHYWGEATNKPTQKPEQIPAATLEAEPEDTAYVFATPADESWAMYTVPEDRVSVLTGSGSTMALFLFPGDHIGDTRCVVVVPRDEKKMAWLIDRKENTVTPFYYYAGIDSVLFPKWCNEQKK